MTPLEALEEINEAIQRSKAGAPDIETLPMIVHGASVCEQWALANLEGSRQRAVTEPMSAIVRDAELLAAGDPYNPDPVVAGRMRESLKTVLGAREQLYAFFSGPNGAH